MPPHSRWRLPIVASLVLSVCLAIGGCGLLNLRAGTPFSGIPAQSEPEVDHANSSRSN